MARAGRTGTRRGTRVVRSTWYVNNTDALPFTYHVPRTTYHVPRELQMALVDEHLGRILLGIAVVLTILLLSQNTALSLAAIPDEELNRKVQVELDPKALPTASPEKYFAGGTAPDYAGGPRCI